MQQELAEKRLIVWSDIDSAVRVWQENSATMNFEVLDVVGYTGPAETDPVYWQDGERSSLPGTVSHEAAEVLAHGFIKFDGCSHWGFQEHYMLHLCGREDLENFATMQRRLYDEAQRLIGESWCG